MKSSPIRRVPGRLLIELDDLASAMLRKVIANGTPTIDPHEDPRDLVNAAVTFFLCDEDEKSGKFHLGVLCSALARAERDRLKGEKAIPGEKQSSSSPRRAGWPPSIWPVGLSKKADGELRAFCLQHGIHPEFVLAYFCRCFLNNDYLRDRLNAEGVIDDARRQERTEASRKRRHRKEAA